MRSVLPMVLTLGLLAGLSSCGSLSRCGKQCKIDKTKCAKCAQKAATKKAAE